MFIDILTVLLVFGLGFQFPLTLDVSRTDLFRLRWLWVYHLVFGIVFYYYISAQGGSDSLKYWSEAKNITGDTALDLLFEKRGTRVMYALNYIPSNLFDLSFFTGTVLYCLVGYIGLAYFYKIAIYVIPYNYKIKAFFLFPAIFYFPNLHFWSSAIGKDTILFFAVGLFSYAFMKFNKRLWLIAFSLLLAYLVRPHIALFLVLAFSMAYLMNSTIATYKRILLFIILLGIGIVMLPSVLEYTQVEELSVESYESFSQTKVNNLSRAHTGSSVDMGSYPLPLKIFTFLYRPTFIDITSITALLAAVENLILLILTILVLRKRPIETFRKAPFLIKGLVFFLSIGSVAFSMSLGNLGIMLRMRNMFLPGMLIYFLWCFSFEIERCLVLKRRKLKPLQHIVDAED